MVAAAPIVSLVIALHVCSGTICQSHTPCTPTGYLRGTNVGNCSTDPTDCCRAGELYPQYQCSPPVTGATPARMYSVSFTEGGDGGAQAECDGKYHGDDEMVVALSTGWYDGGSRCLKNIRIEANGRSAVAKVVDECNSVNGCDEVNAFSPPSPNNVVNANPAVWKALGITDEIDVGDYEITWSDA